MKLSVVIPVYRVEQTLNRCVESVLCQGIDDMEVILVDDGSPDRCPQMCDDWANKDARIQVIHKKNGGLSDARNAGIDIATGEYITFVDSDDYIAPDTYQPLLRQLTAHPEYDIIEYPCDRKGTRYEYGEEEYRCMEEYWLKCQAYRHSYACNKLYRRLLFNTIRYPKGRVFEDIDTLPQLLQNACVVATSRCGTYFYTDNSNGITAIATGEQIALLTESNINAFLWLGNKGRKEEREAYYLHIIDLQLETYSKKGPLLLPPYQGSLSFSRHYSLPCNIKLAMYKLFGIKRLCQIYNILNKLILHR